MSALANVFEDPSGIREGGWLRLVPECQRVPDDYGVAWYLPDRMVAVCAPMPFHRLLGWAYRRYWTWRVRREAAGPLEHAYDAGVAWARQHSDRERAFLCAQHDLALQRAYTRGRTDMLTDLKVGVDDYLKARRMERES